MNQCSKYECHKYESDRKVEMSDVLLLIFFFSKKIPHFRSNFADAKLLQMDLERWMLTGEEELRGQGTEERK